MTQFVLNRSSWVLAAVLIGVAIPAMAEQTHNVGMQNATTGDAQYPMTTEQTATMWGLTTNEYQHYLKEMATTPSARWWKHLDPPQVLGQNATTEEERMTYAEIDVRLDQERASREVAFQHAYDTAFAKLYPHAKLVSINTNPKRQAAKLHSNDQYFLFTPINDPEGSLLAGKLIGLMRSKEGVRVNIYFVGTASLNQIQRWARNNNIPKHLQNDDTITLNHNAYDGTNTLKRIMGSTHVTLPILIRVRDGHSQVVSLLSL